jgi:hypothetical protein
MAAPPFDPNGAVRFDLRSGAASDSRGARLVLVPSAALASLGPDALTKIGLAIGRACGERVASRLGGDGGVRATQLEVVISHLAGELAISGAFAIHIERWGRAMVAIVSNPSIADDMFIGAVLGGALSAASGRDVAAAALGRAGAEARYFLGSPSTADHVRVLVGKGMSYAEVLASLQGGAS